MAEPNLGEFRYVFYSSPGNYDETCRFYHDTLEFPIVGGFSNGTYMQCGKGIVEIIDGSTVTPFQRQVLRGTDAYSPPRGGFLLIEVPDLDRARSRLSEAGANIVVEPTDYPWRFRTLSAIDPSGNLVSLFVRLPGWEERHANRPE